MTEQPKPEPAEVVTVTCPHCRQPTDRVQEFDVPVVVFGLIFLASSTERVAGCPTCVRKRLWAIFQVSIPMANIAFAAVGPFIGRQIYLSHQMNRPGIPPQYHHWAEIPPAQRPPASHKGIKTVPLIIAASLLIGVVVFIFVVLPRLVR